MEEKMKIDPVVFYRCLPRKEKGVFLSYLERKYGFRTTTMYNKLGNSKRGHLKKSEEILIIQAIEGDSWRR